MAERRMFARAVVDSDLFLDMPLSTQALYFHLGMHGDDDGFVSNPRKIQRMIGASDDDMKLLIAKGFVIIFESGVVVLRHWKIHNYIQADRYKPTLYTTEKALLLCEKGKAYAFLSDSDTCCIQPVSNLDTSCTRRIGKASLGEIREGKDRPPISPTGEKPRRKAAPRADGLFEQFWMVYPRKVAKQNAEKAWNKLNPDETLAQQIITAVERFRLDPQWLKDNGQFIPHAATFLNGRRWEDETEVKTHGINGNPDAEWDEGLDEEGREELRRIYARECMGL